MLRGVGAVVAWEPASVAKRGEGDETRGGDAGEGVGLFVVKICSWYHHRRRKTRLPDDDSRLIDQSTPFVRPAILVRSPCRAIEGKEGVRSCRCMSPLSPSGFPQSRTVSSCPSAGKFPLNKSIKHTPLLILYSMLQNSLRCPIQHSPLR